jgi:hypothetical protein
LNPEARPEAAPPLRRRANQWFLFARPALDQEGRFAVVTNVWSGMRWTRMAPQTSGVTADGEVVWSWHRDADAKLAIMLRITPMTVAKKPVHRGDHEGSRKTIARGMPDVFRCDRGDLLVCFLSLHARLRAHRAPGIPCAL